MLFFRRRIRNLHEIHDTDGIAVIQLDDAAVPYGLHIGRIVGVGVVLFAVALQCLLFRESRAFFVKIFGKKQRK